MWNECTAKEPKLCRKFLIAYLSTYLISILLDFKDMLVLFSSSHQCSAQSCTCENGAGVFQFTSTTTMKVDGFIDDQNFLTTLQKWIFYAFWYRFLLSRSSFYSAQFYWNSIFKYLDAVCGCWVSPQILHHHYRYRPCFASFSWKNILFEIIANRYSMMFFFPWEQYASYTSHYFFFVSPNTFFILWVMMKLFS